MTPERIALMEAAKMRLCDAMAAEMARSELTATELLALCAFITGVAIANQDARRMDPTSAMAIVMENIQRGNAVAVADLLGTKGAMN